MKNASFFSFETIRQFCGFSTHNGIREQWRDFVHVGITPPGRYDDIDADLLKPLLAYMAEDKNGRKPRSIAAARYLLYCLVSGESPDLEQFESTLDENGQSKAPEAQIKAKDLVRSDTAKAQAPTPKQSNPIQSTAGESPAPLESKPEIPLEGQPKAKPESKGRKVQSMITFSEWLYGTFGDFMPIDLVTYGSTILIYVSAYSILPSWGGLFFAFLLSIVLMNSLFIAKNRRLRDANDHALIGVWLSELIASVLHWSMFYNILNENRVKLPWRFGMDNDSTYNITAVVMAAIVATWSIYSIYNRINVKNAALYADEFMQTHGREY